MLSKLPAQAMLKRFAKRLEVSVLEIPWFFLTGLAGKKFTYAKVHTCDLLEYMKKYKDKFGIQTINFQGDGVNLCHRKDVYLFRTCGGLLESGKMIT